MAKSKNRGRKNTKRKIRQKYTKRRKYTKRAKSNVARGNLFTRSRKARKNTTNNKTNDLKRVLFFSEAEPGQIIIDGNTIGKPTIDATLIDLARDPFMGEQIQHGPEYPLNAEQLREIIQLSRDAEEEKRRERYRIRELYILQGFNV